jgi:osmotically-inducible protein OsmY
MYLKTFRSGIALLILAAGISTASCKGKQADNESTTPTVDTTTTIDNTRVTPAPEIAGDDSLTTGVRDAVKDFPGVTATVKNGEVTLEGGPVNRDQLQTIMQSVQSLHPKKVNNNLTVK